MQHLNRKVALGIFFLFRGDVFLVTVIFYFHLFLLVPCVEDRPFHLNIQDTNGNQITSIPKLPKSNCCMKPKIPLGFFSNPQNIPEH